MPLDRPLPPPRDKDARTPFENRPSLVELTANTEAIGRLTGEIGRVAGAVDGMAAWSREHDVAHASLVLELDGLRKGQGDLTLAMREHTRAEIKRRPLTTKQVAAWASAGAVVIAALSTGSTQVVAAIGSHLTSTARAQSKEVATQQVQQIDSKRHEQDVQEAARRGFELGQQQMDVRWQERLMAESRKANERRGKTR